MTLGQIRVSDMSSTAADRLRRLLALPFAAEHEVRLLSVPQVELLLDDLASGGAEGREDEQLARFRDEYCGWLLAAEGEGQAVPNNTALGTLEEQLGAEQVVAESALGPAPEKPEDEVPSLWSVASAPQLSVSRDAVAAAVPEARPLAPDSDSRAVESASLWSVSGGPVFEAAPPDEASAPYAQWPGGVRSQEFLALANRFSDLRSAAMPPNQAERLTAECLCFAVESECQDRFHPALEALWPERNARLQPILSSTATRPAFSPSAQQFLRQAEELHRAATGSPRLPEAALLHALRYLLVCLRREHFAPTLLDYGALILFFGAGPFGDGTYFRRLEPAKATELALVLLRLQRLRNETVNVAHFWERSRNGGCRVLLDEVSSLSGTALRLLSVFGREGQ